MSRQFFLIVAVVTLAGIFASGQTAAQTTPNAGPFGGVILSTPTATLASPAPTVGISDAGRAGITAAMPVNTGVTGTPESSTIVYTSGAVVNPSGVNTSTAAANAPGQTTIDLGPSFYSDTIGGNANAASLAEIAARFKTAKGAVNARTLTNGDVLKLVSEKTGVTMAKNMPPVSPGAIPQSGASAQTATAQPAPAQSATQSTTQSTTQAQTSTQAAQSNPSTAQPSQAGAAESEGQNAGAESSSGASTTPQINRNQQSNDAQGRSKLPATSTLLPLFGLLGLVSGGLGLWFLRLRK